MTNYVNHTTTEDIMLSELDLATRWKLSVKALQKQRLAGQGCDYIRLGKTTIRYKMSDILAFERYGKNDGYSRLSPFEVEATKKASIS
jgi:hypothetical protein